ncbi:hypothetical protein ABPG73_004688 [Tetrahymena malaccensis]
MVFYVTIDKNDPLLIKLSQTNKYENYPDFQSKTKEAHLKEIREYQIKGYEQSFSPSEKKSLLDKIYIYVDMFENLKNGKCFTEKWYEEYETRKHFMASYKIMKKFAHSLPYQAYEIIKKYDYQLDIFSLYTCIQKLSFALQLRQLCDIIFKELNQDKIVSEKQKNQHEHFNQFLEDVATFLKKHFTKIEDNLNDLTEQELQNYRRFNNNLDKMRQYNDEKNNQYNNEKNKQQNDEENKQQNVTQTNQHNKNKQRKENKQDYLPYVIIIGLLGAGVGIYFWNKS